MRKIVLILVSIAAVAVIGVAVFLSQLNTGGGGEPPAQNETGTCAPRDTAAPDATANPDGSAAPKDESECLNPGNEGKPGEGTKG